jgi:hypothetical protein
MIYFGLFIRCVCFPLHWELSEIVGITTDRFGSLVAGTQKLCSAKLLPVVF